MWPCGSSCSGASASTGAEVAWPTRRAAELVAAARARRRAPAAARAGDRRAVADARRRRRGGQPAQGRPPRAPGAGDRTPSSCAAARSRCPARPRTSRRSRRRRRGRTAATCCPTRPTRTWTQAPRERLRALHLERAAGRAGTGRRLVAADPTDEPAYRELMRRALAAGSRPAAIRWYGRLRTALRRELRHRPGRGDGGAVRASASPGCVAPRPRFVGRELELARIAAALRRRAPGVLAVRGRPASASRRSAASSRASPARDGWTVVGDDGDRGAAARTRR